jgi:hypothetical protein
LRAAKIGKRIWTELHLERQRKWIWAHWRNQKTNSKFIIPINFPEAYDVSDPNQANQMELKDLRFGIKHQPILSGG